MREIPKPFEIYKHFKGMLYQVHGVALHSESGEQMVVYQQLYAPYGLYVRPLDMFLSEVDHEKYPNVSQKYRFEKIQAPAYEMQTGNEPAPVKIEKTTEQKVTNVSENKEVVEEKVTPTETWTEEDLETNPEIELLTPFFDADTYEEKLEVLSNLHPQLTNSMIDTMAVCLDVEVKPGELETRYAELKNCLLTMEHFECNRLR